MKFVIQFMKTFRRALKYVLILLLVFVFLCEYLQNTPANTYFDTTEVQISAEAASEGVAQDYDRTITPKFFVVRVVLEKLTTPDYYLARNVKNYLADLKQFFFQNIYFITVTSLAP